MDYEKFRFGNAGFQLFTALATANPVGIAAGIFAFAVDILEPTDYRLFKMELKKLSEKGYDAYVKGLSNRKNMHLGIPDKKRVINYIFECIDKNVPPTISELKKAALMDDSEANQMMHHLLGYWLQNPEFTLRYRLWDCIERVCMLDKKLDTFRQDDYLLEAQVIKIKEKVNEFERVLDHDFARYLSNLNINPKPTNSIFSYTSEVIKFSGRTKEMKLLNEFCESDGKIRWWAITAPGGSGKSRLAYELCKSMTLKGWYSIFLPSTFFKKYQDFRDWSFPCELLIIIDYAAFYGKQIAEMLEIIAQSKTTTKIRIVFLERQGFAEYRIPQWFIDIQRNIDNRLLEQLCYNNGNPAINLTCLSRENYEEIILGYCRSRNIVITKKSTNLLLEKLNKVDPTYARPLYLLFILEAMADNLPWDRWNIFEIQNHIYSKEKRRINGIVGNVNFIDVCLSLWTFSTATISFNLKNSDFGNNCFVSDILNDIRHNGIGIRQLQEYMRSICDCNDYFDVSPYLPDMIGEFFVLTELADNLKYDKAYVTKFVQSAWSFAPVEFSHFLIRIVDDYIGNENFFILYRDDCIFQRPGVSGAIDHYQAVKLYMNLTLDEMKFCGMKIPENFVNTTNSTINYADFKSSLPENCKDKVKDLYYIHLVNNYYKKIIGYARITYNNYDLYNDICMDIVNDFFLWLYSHIDDLGEIKNLGFYIYHSIQKKIHMHYMRQQYYIERNIPLSEEGMEIPSADEYGYIDFKLSLGSLSNNDLEMINSLISGYESFLCYEDKASRKIFKKKRDIVRNRVQRIIEG